ncbi:MAG: helix-turn-helix transcriptional regulator [Fimbriimonadaceae bacterium]|nr:helix-turn-helix transcriptional regulator [Fimbriimonadaceae bacterium]QYK56600.1 MAG: helix-turn-helix transcriptional regulator [Fimbriimonadaceae bacterium]
MRISGDEARSLRHRLGLTQVQLAERLSCSLRGVQALEQRGGNGTLARELQRLAASGALGSSADHLMIRTFSREQAFAEIFRPDCRAVGICASVSLLEAGSDSVGRIVDLLAERPVALCYVYPSPSPAMDSLVAFVRSARMQHPRRILLGRVYFLPFDKETCSWQLDSMTSQLSTYMLLERHTESGVVRSFSALARHMVAQQPLTGDGQETTVEAFIPLDRLAAKEFWEAHHRFIPDPNIAPEPAPIEEVLDEYYVQFGWTPSLASDKDEMEFVG